MNKKRRSIHILVELVFFVKKKNNTLVWKDKNGFIKKKYGFITFFGYYTTISHEMMDHIW